MNETAATPVVGQTVKVPHTSEIVTVTAVNPEIDRVTTRYSDGSEGHHLISQVRPVPTVETLAVAYRKVADQLEQSGHLIHSDRDVDCVVYNLNTREELVAQAEYGPDEELALANLLVWDSANGDFGDVAREATRLFNRTLAF